MNKLNWKHSFYTIWAGQAVSLITSAVLQMAIIWHLTATTGSALILSMATMVGFLPQALLGTFIGVLVDRFSKKKVMIFADIIIACAGVTLAIVSFIIQLPIWLIFLVLFVRSIGTAFHSPALNAVTPQLVPKEELTKCAGYSQSIQSISFILSPALAGVIYAMWGLNMAIAFDVFGAIVACITVIIVKIPKQEIQSTIEKISMFKEAKAGYAILKQNKGLFSLLWITAVYCFIYMPINALFPLMSMGYFGGTTTNASIVEVVFAVGMLIGGLLLAKWGGFKKRNLSIFTSFLAMGGALTISGLLPTNGYIIFAICSFFMGISAPFYSGVQTVLIQEKIEEQYLGRVFGLIGSIMSLSMPLGLIISGIFADKIGINIWFAISGACILLLALLSLTLPSMRKLDN